MLKGHLGEQTDFQDTAVLVSKSPWIYFLMAPNSSDAATGTGQSEALECFL